MSETDAWDKINKEYVLSVLHESGLNEEQSIKAVDVFIKILQDVEDSESNHIKNHIISSNDIRSAALCFEAMGAFNLLKNKIGESN